MHLKWRRNLLLGVLGILLLLVLLVNYRTLLPMVAKPWFSRATLIAELRGHGVWAAPALVLLLAVVSMIPGAPNSVVAIVSGVCLGAPLGFAVNVVGLSLGNNLGARLVDKVEAHSKRNSRLLNDLTKAKHPKVALLLAYAVPFVPNTLVHVAAAKLDVTGRTLVPVVVAASVPTAFCYAFGGDAVLQFNWPRLAVAAVILALSAGVITLIRKDRRKA